MKKVFLETLSLVLFVCVAHVAVGVDRAFAVSGINKQIPFYGTLADGGGNVLSGTYSMRFQIYDVATGGSSLWDKSYDVVVTDGSFSVLLGSGVGNEMTVDFSQDEYYLGITVGADGEMSPRERLGASPYAFNADTVDGFHASDFLVSNNPLSINLETDTSLLTIKQSGEGNYLSFLDGGDAELFAMRHTGELYTKSLQVVDDTHFGGNVHVADGSGLAFGAGNGVMLWQNMVKPSDLMLTPVGESVGGDGDVRIVSPKALSLRANADRTDSGDEYPGLIFNDDGLAQLINLSGELSDNARLELSFTGGTEVTDGGFRVTDGGIEVTDVGITITSGDLAVADNVIISSLAGSGGVDIAVDNTGTIVVSGTSDERFKQNIETLDDALSTLLNLRGVRYEWIDTERFGEQTEIGFIAQEVQRVVPEVVRDNGEYLSLNTKNLLAVVVEAVKELYENMNEYFTRTERLEREVDVLRAELDALKQEDTTHTERSAPGDLPPREDIVDEEVVSEESITEESETEQTESATEPTEIL